MDFSREADAMCSVLVDEIRRTTVWAHLKLITEAILHIRMQEKAHVREGQHLSGERPFPGSKAAMEKLAKEQGSKALGAFPGFVGGMTLEQACVEAGIVPALKAQGISLGKEEDERLKEFLQKVSNEVNAAAKGR